MTNQQLKPWERLPAVGCERCGRQATRRIAAGTFEIRPGEVLVGSDPLIASALVCDNCEEAVGDEFLDRYDGASGEPLRHSWRTWFFHTPLGRPFDRLAVAWWNWRFERQYRRAVRCAHAFQATGDRTWYCPKCGTWRVDDIERLA